MKHIFRRRQKPSPPRGLCPHAAHLAIVGEVLMLLAVFDFAARVNVAYLSGSEGVFLRLSDFGGSLSASAVILWAFVLGLDYWERTQREE